MSPRERFKGRHIFPGLGGPVEHVDDRGERLSPQLLLRTGVQQCRANALHDIVVGTLRLAVMLR